MKGKASIPLPDRFNVDFLDKELVDIILRFNRQKFANLGFVKVNSLENSTAWVDSDGIRRAAPDFNPFVEGEDYEIDILPTRHGYVIYVDGLYALTYDVTISLAGDIAFMRSKGAQEIYDISF